MENHRTKFDLFYATKLEEAAMERVVIAIRSIIGSKRVQFEDCEARAILEGTHALYSAVVSFTSKGETFATFTTRLGSYTFEGRGAAMAGGVPRLSVLVHPQSPTKSDGTRNPEVQGNWPQDAIVAVKYSMKDRQFPNVDHASETVYFSTLAESEEWFAEKQNWIKGTDYDFSISCDVYEWDLGPHFVCTLQY